MRHLPATDSAIPETRVRLLAAPEPKDSMHSVLSEEGVMLLSCVWRPTKITLG